MISHAALSAPATRVGAIACVMVPALLLGLPLLTLFVLPADALAADTVSLHSPRGGWRVSDRGGDFVQGVNYPASRVNVREGSSGDAQIRGAIRSDIRRVAGAKPVTGGRSSPATLIVNGAPMPLESDEDGGFARPYAFAAGSNSVEVRSADGRSRKRVQFLDAGQAARPRLRVLLSWDSPGTDVDLHVITPNGQHCFYGNRIIEGGGALDVDVTTGYGPEIFATARPERGVWHIYVNYFGGGGGDADDAASARKVTTAQVVVIDAEGTPSETRRTYRVPLRSTGDLQHVSSFSTL